VSVAVTLLVPNYNGETFLAETLGALLAQTYPNFELILVDNRSTDASLAIARSIRDPRLRIIEADTHVELVANFNRAASLVETPMFAICAADEAYEPGWLAAVVDLLERHPDAFAALSKADSIDETGRVYLAPEERFKDRFWPPGEPVRFAIERQISDLRRANYLLFTACVFRSEFTRQIGPLNESYTFVADWEYWYRGLFAGHTIVGTHRRLMHYRRHRGMMSQQLGATLQRFEEELAMANWVAREGQRLGFFPDARPFYGQIQASILSHFTARLSGGDREGAAQLLEFAEQRVPEVASSAAGRLMRGAHAVGRPGGLALKLARAVYLRSPRLPARRR
jgi:glycosyltransferase involved in cell wall biosynthesis